jgi:protein TonB
VRAIDPPRALRDDADLPWWRRYARIEGRTLAFLVVQLVHLLLGFMLLTLSPKLARKPLEMAMELRNFAEPKTQQATAAPKAKTAVKTPKPPTPVHPPTRPPIPPQNLTFGPQVDPSFDISKMPNHKAEMAQADGDSSGDATAAIGPGQGPNGEPLYNAEWYREPTHAELVTYLPPAAGPGSWAIIACRTIEQFRVEDCEIIDESPRGIGLARGLQNAAWQFRVRPPRKGGKAMIGAWVKIRYDITDGGPGPR